MRLLLLCVCALLACADPTAPRAHREWDVRGESLHAHVALTDSLTDARGIIEASGEASVSDTGLGWIGSCTATVDADYTFSCYTAHHFIYLTAKLAVPGVIPDSLTMTLVHDAYPAQSAVVVIQR